MYVYIKNIYSSTHTKSSHPISNSIATCTPILNQTNIPNQLFSPSHQSIVNPGAISIKWITGAWVRGDGT